MTSERINGLSSRPSFEPIEALNQDPNQNQKITVANRNQPDTTSLNVNGESSPTAFSERRGINGNDVRQARLSADAASVAPVRFNYNGIAGVQNNPNVSSEFINRVEQIAQRLGTQPEFLLAVMSFETGGSFSPSEKNFIGATGLIQFIPATAEALGTTTTSLAQMSSVEQLDYVEKYFRPFAGKLNTLEGVYTSVLSGRPRPNPDAVLFERGSKAYEQNPLDWNQDGKITSSEATTPVAARLFGGVKAVQQRLVDLGFVAANRRGSFVNGKLGSETATAISKFQRSRGLNPTGTFDVATGRAMFDAATEPAPPAPTPQPTRPTQPPQSTEPSGNNTNVPAVNLERGSKGTEVQKLQDVLVMLGHLTSADVQSGPGVFGARTENAVKQFQLANNLTPSGKLDAATRRAMISIELGMGRGQNANTNVIGALQEKLVELGLMTKAQVGSGQGTFGPQTENALKRFQADRNIQQTGVLNATTYRALQNVNSVQSASTIDRITTPNSGPVNVLLPPSGTGFVTYNRDGNDQYGTAQTIRALETIAARWAEKHPDIPLSIGDISRSGGGKLEPHASHQRGIDVDFRPLRKDGQSAPTNFNAQAYDRERTREFIKLVKEVYPNANIIFNDPVLIGEGLTRAFKGHNDHVHVSFK